MGDIFTHSIKINDDYTVALQNKKSNVFTSSGDLARWLYINNHRTPDTASGIVIKKQGTQPSIVVDDMLSLSSTNPVQNKVVTNAINVVADSVDDLDNDLSSVESNVNTLSSNVTSLSNTVNNLSNNAVTTTQKESNGIKLSNGLVINWGTVTPGKDGTRVNLAVPFTTIAYAVGATNLSINNKQIRALAVSSYASDHFVCYGQYSQNTSGFTGGDVTFRWIAVGF